MHTRVKELREQKKVSQLTLATRVGVSQNTISRIEKEEGEPTAGLLIEMSKYFGVSVDYILCLTSHRYTVEMNARLNSLLKTSKEYLENYERLSTKSRQAIDTILKRMAEIDQEDR